MNLRFCEDLRTGDLIGVVEKSVGVRLRERMSLSTDDSRTHVSPLSVGIVVQKKFRKSRNGGYNWCKVVFKDYSEGILRAGWVCFNTSSLCLQLLERIES